MTKAVGILDYPGRAADVALVNAKKIETERDQLKRDIRNRLSREPIDGKPQEPFSPGEQEGLFAQLRLIAAQEGHDHQLVRQPSGIWTKEPFQLTPAAKAEVVKIRGRLETEQMKPATRRALHARMAELYQTGRAQA